MGKMRCVGLAGSFPLCDFPLSIYQSHFQSIFPSDNIPNPSINPSIPIPHPFAPKPLFLELLQKPSPIYSQTPSPLHWIRVHPFHPQSIEILFPIICAFTPYLSVNHTQIMPQNTTIKGSSALASERKAKGSLANCIAETRCITYTYNVCGE